MKLIKLLYLSFLIVTISCSKSHVNSTDNSAKKTNHNIPIVGKTYSHKFEDCTGLDMAEMSCSESLDFLENNNVDAHLYGGDIIFRTKYIYNSDDLIITVKKGEGIPEDIKFKIISSTEIKSLKNMVIWKKEE